MTSRKLDQAVGEAYFIYKDGGNPVAFMEALERVLEAFSELPDSGTAQAAFMASKPSQRSRLTWGTHFKRAGL